MDGNFMRIVFLFSVIVLDSSAVGVYSEGNQDGNHFTTQSISAVAGTSVELTCTITGLSGPMVWGIAEEETPLVIGNFVFSKDPRYTIESPSPDTYRFGISDVRVTDSGKYIAAIGSDARNWKSCVFDLDVTEKGGRLQQDRLVITGPGYVNRGDELVLVCALNALVYQQDKFDWYKDGLHLTSGLHTLIKDVVIEGLSSISSALVIRNAQMSDAGTYVCRSQETFDTASLKVTVLAESTTTPEPPMTSSVYTTPSTSTYGFPEGDPNEETSKKRDISAAPGSTVSMTCELRGPSGILTWKKDDYPVPIAIKDSLFIPDPRLSIENAANNTYTFIISNVRTSDSGRYRALQGKGGEIYHSCTFDLLVSDEEQKVKSAIKRGLVITGPSFVNRGNELMLVCALNARMYQHGNLAWFKDGVRLTPGLNIIIQDLVNVPLSLSSSTLIVRHASMADAGTYVCRSSGFDVTSLKVNVISVTTTPLPSVTTTAYIDPLEPSTVPQVLSLVLHSTIETIPAVSEGDPNEKTSKIRDISTVPGSTVSMMCKLRGRSGILTWKKDKYRVPIAIKDSIFIPDPRFSIENAGKNTYTFIISNVRTSDSGRYLALQEKSGEIYHACTFDLLVSNEEQKMDSAVKQGLVITGPDHVNRGDELVLVCALNARVYQQGTLDWFKDGLRLTPGSHTHIQHMVNEPLSLISSTLVIRNAQMSEAGTYVCRSSDLHVTFLKVNVIDVTTPQPPITTTVYSDPLEPSTVPQESDTRVINYPGDVTARIGNDVILWCKTDESPSPPVTWYSLPADESQPNIVIDSEGDVLIIRNVGKSNAGNYECVITDGKSSGDKRSMKLTVEYPPEVHVTRSILDDRSIMAECSILANPMGYHSWTRNGVRIRSDDTYSVNESMDEQGLITISLRVSDPSAMLGEFMCVAMNQFGIVNASFTISALETTSSTPSRKTPPPPLTARDALYGLGPKLNVPVKEVTVKEGDKAILQCAVDDLGNFKVVWIDQWSTLLSFDDRRIIDDDRISVERPYSRDWNLHIRRVAISDGGRYTCQINTRPVQQMHVVLNVIQMTSTSRVEVSSSPAPTVEPTTVTGGEILSINPKASFVMIGSPFKFSCKYEGNSNEISFKWERDGRQVGKGRRRYTVISRENEATLEIAEVTRKDNASFSCIVHTGSEEINVVTMLTVVKDQNIGYKYGLPRFISHPKLRAVEKGRPLDIDCQVQSDPSNDPLLIHWKKDNQELAIDGVRIVKESQGLTIHNSTEDDSGRYQCIAENLIGVSASLSAHMYVKVRRVLPKFTVTPPEEFSTGQGTNITLECAASGEPKPRVKWVDHDAPYVQRDLPIGTAVLELPKISVRADKPRKFTCVASSELGEITHTTRIYLDQATTVDPHGLPHY